MYVDYTDLNKACPKDAYPLPSIDRLVDGASGHALLNFLDAYFGYNQIMLYQPNEKHTAFITDHANFCYHVMSFGLKNAGATYQRLIDKVFHQQIGQNMEVYVDDMVLKTTSTDAHVADLAEVFNQIQKHNMHLNPEKCIFRVQRVNKSEISVVMLQERDKNQTPIYYISRVLQDTKKRYQTIEKLAFALVTSARRLRPYFRSHQVVVKTDYPIKQILRKPELAGCMIAWSVELSEFGIRYENRGPLKAQCLANFVAKLTPILAKEEQVWALYVDGSSNTKGGGAGIILEGPNNVTIEQSLKFRFRITNNQAEYEALLAGLRLARDIGAQRVSCNSDSKLMVEQLNGTYQTKDALL
ncbi:uncharacterized protein LOC109787951 [Cajanus cajan]|uniref:uncharacterized protein LOC109787951 n=1 Tax=Cajanus cajan TaxID=3821 RepID=UPI00098D7B79|nr:uncharacterized protein LOC109787951 [Cajanus cajan]